MRPQRKKGYVPLTHAICQVLNLFCKVRGEKVVKGFLNNEPRYLEPILNELATGANYATTNDEPLPQSLVPWTERYVLLLWLSHLLLAPFPLASMSALQSSKEASVTLGIDLPSEVPGIALRVLVRCTDALRSASKERGAAANLLVRLCIRPDMQQLGLLDALVHWSLSYFKNISAGASDIHECLGMLTFLSGLVTSATNEEIGPFLPAIFQICQSINNERTLDFVKSSAVARKLIVKMFRNIVVHCLKADDVPNGLDTTTVLEDVIEFLLQTLGDGDTPVRYAASKALSIVTMKLDEEMAVEVVEAILGSLGENVYWQGSQRNLSAVDPLRWHGLTLTLSHLLYQRAVSTTQLPEILNALILAHAFEQRSATGGSIGTNVRDAACFGLWAVSRRYTTNEMLAVETSSVRASEHQKSLSILQVLAIELIVVACLDPAGNIRRGSSAALQELIGRHPNTVEGGIPLVQIVDFHAVGLRERGLCEVAPKAASMSNIYWEALFENLLGWRGTGSLDAPSRLYAARAIGLLSENQSAAVINRMENQMCSQLALLASREVEERQGLVSALAALIDQASLSKKLKIADQNKGEHVDLTRLWRLLTGALQLEEKSFISPTLRPELTASSSCTFLGALSTMSCSDLDVLDATSLPTQELIRLFNLCLGRHSDAVIAAIPRTTSSILELLGAISQSDRDEAISGWLSKLENEASYNGLRWSGFAIALGAAYSSLDKPDGEAGVTATQMRIVEVLTFRCTSAVAIEARSVALQAIDVLLKSSASSLPLDTNVKDQIAKALCTTLNDYTVTERGDVGSLVRLEALSTVGTAWDHNVLDGSKFEKDFRADVIRLSLEKLDKIRLRAAQVLSKAPWMPQRGAGYDLQDGVSSYTYFANTLALLQTTKDPAILEAICLGFITSAGMGSESVVQNSRAALLDAVEAWSITDAEGKEPCFSLQDFATQLLELLKTNLDTERAVLPLLEVFAFLFDMQILQRLTTSSFKWVPNPSDHTYFTESFCYSFRILLSYTQKAHFKSSNMQKLHLALNVYRGLGTIEATRADTITKVMSMLLHPFPKVRLIATAL
jgi:hypothetical protein